MSRPGLVEFVLVLDTVSCEEDVKICVLVLRMVRCVVKKMFRCRVSGFHNSRSDGDGTDACPSSFVLIIIII